MPDRPRISELNTVELLARAAEYRRMAATATTAGTRDALVRLAARFERTALQRADNDNGPLATSS